LNWGAQNWTVYSRWGSLGQCRGGGEPQCRGEGEYQGTQGWWGCEDEGCCGENKEDGVRGLLGSELGCWRRAGPCISSAEQGRRGEEM